MVLLRSILLAAVLSTCLVRSGYSAGSISDDALMWSSRVTLPALQAHLRAFQRFGDENDGLFSGSRFTGTKGYEASRDYVISKLREANYDIEVQQFPLPLNVVDHATFRRALTGTEYQEKVDYTPFLNSGEGEVLAEVRILSKDGCDESDYSEFKRGDILLLERTTKCEMRKRVVFAVAAGAKAVLITNNSPGIFFIGLDGKLPPPSLDTPVAFISQELGDSLLKTVRSNKPEILYLRFQGGRRELVGENIIATSRGGDPDHIVMAGAHLDSSSGSPGMNDNASSVAAVLESALQFKDMNLKRKLVVAFWAGEEIRLVGSTYYVENLPKEQLAKIDLYLNYELLGTPNGGRFIMAPPKNAPKGAKDIANLYSSYFSSQHLSSFQLPSWFGAASERSDMKPFNDAGVPSGFIGTGAEMPWNPLMYLRFRDLYGKRKSGLSMHPCYHKPCDTLSMRPGETTDPNFDFDLYLEMSQAAAYAIAHYAMEDPVN